MHDGWWCGPREGRRGDVLALWRNVLAVRRRVLEVVRAEDLLFLWDEAELVARAEEAAASDSGFVCEDLVLDWAREEDHKRDTRWDDNAETSGYREKFGSKHSIVYVMVRPNTIDGQYYKGYCEEKAENDANGIELVKLGQPNNGARVDTFLPLWSD
jgi:hypothetical protein